ncbi:unnamed protein product [Adineta steineri]|uniref:Uncharacterized protein n=1 Tax=Adineta steineri TaxID=433720 RepID=A0A819WWJ8_9BILA|nr:unnamed protein product [Adineta steineri]CAF4130130.1 unnamed protein product [Adineta steineri]
MTSGIKLIRHGSQLIFRRFLLPVQPRENLAVDGQLFVEMCEKDKEFICLQFWVEDFVHEHNQWKDGGYIDNGQNISCSFNRSLLRQLREKHGTQHYFENSSFFVIYILSKIPWILIDL